MKKIIFLPIVISALAISPAAYSRVAPGEPTNDTTYICQVKIDEQEGK